MNKDMKMKGYLYLMFQNTSNMVVYIVCLIALICHSCCGIAESEGTPVGWEPDSSMLHHESAGCDLPILLASDINASWSNSAMMPTKDYAFVIRGLIDDWPAHERWKKIQFLRLYGHRSVRTGSESSIVHSGGRADDHTLLKDMVMSKMQSSPSSIPLLSYQSAFEVYPLQSDLGNPPDPFQNGKLAERDSKEARTTRYGDAFVFDTTILQAVPELLEDISVPAIFHDWDNKSEEEAGQMWHMLSLGPSKSGILFYILVYLYCIHDSVCAR